MARAHGYPDYPFVVIPPYVEATDEAVQRSIDAAMGQIERVLQNRI